ncbi:hypothetical protein AXG55_09625 [Silvanigrella aquatica]|uniref:Rod shape-determining protein MreD n=1 Tax=Silvanigrella aquatica TaxID=1915309 RepID=A0A1L4D1R5_9BACT|nr:hypothetical protein AXG55_09625 [Silvanigrella aquatica]
MANLKFIRSKTSHFIMSLFILIFFVYLQSSLFAKAPSLWLHIDILSIAIVYTSIQHFLPLALIKIIFIAMLLQVSSAVPSGFFVMYFLLILVLSNILSKIFIFNSIFGQFFIFLILFTMKYFLFYFTISHRDLNSFFSLFFISWKGFLITILISLPIFRILMFIDSFFEFIPSHDKKKLIDI